VRSSKGNVSYYYLRVNLDFSTNVLGSGVGLVSSQGLGELSGGVVPSRDEYVMAEDKEMERTGDMVVNASGEREGFERRIRTSTSPQRHEL